MFPRILFLGIFSLGLFSLQGQTEVFLNFQHVFGEEGFQMNQTFTTEDGYDLNIGRLEYYLSEIEIVHDGGQLSPVPNTWLLVQPAADSTFHLGSFNVQSIEEIHFAVGVDSAVNHADPASYAAGHPLAPQNPSMHWGWNAGYRFVALEGYTGPSFLFNYQIHALGDENYNTASVQLNPTIGADSLDIYVKADYKNMFKNMNVSGGMIVHGAVNEAVTLLSNMATEVFSAGEAGPNTAIELQFEGEVKLGPNPGNGQTFLQYDLPVGFNYELQLTDLSGRSIRNITVPGFQGTLQLSHLEAGLYIVNLLQDGQNVSMNKLSIYR